MAKLEGFHTKFAVSSFRHFWLKNLVRCREKDSRLSVSLKPENGFPSIDSIEYKLCGKQACLDFFTGMCHFIKGKLLCTLSSFYLSSTAEFLIILLSAKAVMNLSEINSKQKYVIPCSLVFYKNFCKYT